MALISGDGGGGRYTYKTNLAVTGKSPQAVAFERAQAAAEAKRQADAAENARLLNEARMAAQAAREASVEAMKRENARREALRAAGAAQAQARAYAQRQAGEKAAAAKAAIPQPKADTRGSRIDNWYGPGKSGKKPEVKPTKQPTGRARDIAQRARDAKEARAEAKGAVEARQFAAVRDPESPYGKKFKTLEEWAAEARATAGPGRFVGMVQTDENDNPVFDESKLAFLPGYEQFKGKDGATFWKNPFQAPEFREEDVWRYGASRATDAKWLTEWRKLTLSLGLIDDSAIITDEWSDVDAGVMEWAMAQTNVTKYTDPMDFLRSMKAQGYANPALLGDSSSSSSSGGGGGGGGSGDTLTQHVFNKTGIEDGRAMLRQQMRTLLGRAPTDGEVSQYVAALNAVEAVTPQITTVTSSGSTTTTRTVANAPNPDEQLRRSVETGNAGENQSYEGSQYYDVIQQMMGGGL